MLVKVFINEDGEICREDNGEVIGKKALSIGYSYWDNQGKLAYLKYGYFSNEGEFCELCQLTCCSHECLSERHSDCRYEIKGPQGFYFYEE